MAVYWSFALLLPLLVQSHPIDQEFLPVDCEDVFQNGSIHNGVYTIYPVGKENPMEVYCDMGCTDENERHEGGHWTVIQRRMDGSVNFYRPWDDYKEGFGNKDGEYWLGLQNIYLLTWSGKYELRVDMEDFDGGKVHALYNSFYIEPQSDGYRLHVLDFSDGGAGDSLSYHNEQRFSTYDKDQDGWYWYYSWANCAANHRGGFWFRSCMNTNPNGQYKWKNNIYGSDGVIWYGWRSTSMKTFSMKVKKISFFSS